ncbi:MAG: hypothetical protein ACP5JH_03265 [Bacteroidota bacterium]
MKTRIIAPMVFSLFFLVLGTMLIRQQGTAQTHQHRTQSAGEVLSDSTALDTVMNQIAADEHLSMVMMEKLMKRAEQDSSRMKQMCATMGCGANACATRMKMKEKDKRDHHMMEHHMNEMK